MAYRFKLDFHAGFSDDGTRRAGTPAAYIALNHWSSDATKAIHLSHDCASLRELISAVEDQKKELDELVLEAKRAFAKDAKLRRERREQVHSNI